MKYLPTFGLNLSKLGLLVFIGTALTGCTSSPSESPTQVQTLTPAPVVETKTEIKQEAVLFATKEESTDTLYEGDEKVTQEGKDGVRTLTYLVTYTDNLETARELENEMVTTEPIEKIVQKGTQKRPAPMSSSTPKSSTGSSIDTGNLSGSSSTGGTVKMSTSGICHAPGTTYYDRTENFTPYTSLQACLDAGGRLPKR